MPNMQGGAQPCHPIEYYNIVPEPQQAIKQFSALGRFCGVAHQKNAVSYHHVVHDYGTGSESSLLSPPWCFNCPIRDQNSGLDMPQGPA